MKTLPRRAALVIAASTVALVGGGAYAWGQLAATIPDGNGVIHACYNTTPRQSGALRVIDTDAGQTCNSTYETPLNFNQTGPVGPQGPIGPVGPVGPKGDKGDPGAITVYNARVNAVDLSDAPGGWVLTKSVPAGSYVIQAAYTMVNQDVDDKTYAGCELFAGTDVVGVQATYLAEADAAYGAEETAAQNAVVANFAGGDIRLRCEFDGARTDVQWVSLTAIKVSEVQ